MITLQGRGIDRHLVVDAVEAFPPAFRNPGSSAQPKAITVHNNNGEATLSVSALMIAGDPVWQLIDTSPVDIPGGGSHDFLVKFLPTTIGAAPDGQLTIVNNDNGKPMAAVQLTGMGIGRNVAFGPDTIDLGYTGISSQVSAADILAVTNMDPAVPFTVHAIQLNDDSAFHIDNATDVELPPMAAKRFAVTFEPPAEGDFETTATLFLDQDPDAQAVITLRGHAVSVDVHGGGGCATGHGLGGGAVLLVLVSVLGATRRRRAAGLVVVFAVLPARAFADDVHVGAFDPTPATTGTGFQLDSADVGQSGDWVASGVFSYATNPMVVRVSSNGNELGVQRPISQRTMVELGGAYAFLGSFEAGVRMPLYSQSGDPLGDPTTGLAVRPASGTAFGDLTLHGKIRLVQRSQLTAGAALHVTLPTSTKDQFTGVDLPTARVLGLATVTPISRLTLSFNGGAVLRKTADYRRDIFIEQGSGLAWGAGASFRVAEDLFATGELFGELVPKAKEMTGSLSPIEGLIGASYRIERRFTVGLAVGRGISQGLGAPDLRGTFTLSVASGTSGVLAPVERSPAVVRVVDRDGDGIPDDKDRCPEQAEDKNGIADDDGCPDLDSDHDGIPDWRDPCPAQAEDKDGFQDSDGCPDPDNDGDGVPDAQDRCPDQPETINGIDDDGCPDTGGDTTSNSVSLDQSPAKAAEQTFLRGRELMQQKKYFAACAAFEQSQHLDPAAGTQYNLAGCYVEIGKLATAWTIYRELARTDKKVERRAKSNELATELTPRVPKLKMILKGAPDGVNVFMNGTNVNALIGIEAPVDFGTYTIVAGGPKSRGWRQTVEVKKEGEVTTIEIDLEPQGTP